MLKILHVIDSGGLFGAELLVLNLMMAQVQNGLRPLLLSIGESASGPKRVEIEAKRCGLEVIPLRFKKGLNIRGALEILRKAQQTDTRIIHAHGYKPDILLGIVPKRMRKLPVVGTLHGWTSTRIWSRIWVYELLDTILLKNLDAVAAVSFSIVNHKRLRRFRVRPVLINNGLPCLDLRPDPVTPEIHELIQRTKNRFVIVSVGRLSAEKGYDVLIRAVAKLVRSGVDSILVLIGDGPDMQYLSSTAMEEGIENNVHFAGYVDRPYTLFPYFDVFALSSHTEGLPITVLEAMQAQIPVIATGVGEIPHVLQHGKYGKIVPPGNPDYLFKAFLEIHSDLAAAKKQASAAREHALAEYSIEKMARKYLELYTRVLTN